MYGRKSLGLRIEPSETPALGQKKVLFLEISHVKIFTTYLPT